LLPRSRRDWLLKLYLFSPHTSREQSEDNLLHDNTPLSRTEAEMRVKPWVESNDAKILRSKPGTVTIFLVESACDDAKTPRFAAKNFLREGWVGSGNVDRYSNTGFWKGPGPGRWHCVGLQLQTPSFKLLTQLLCVTTADRVLSKYAIFLLLSPFDDEMHSGNKTSIPSWVLSSSP
jgi:hypothetical protein